MSKPTPQFVAALTRIMAAYGKPLPDTPVMQAWWNALAPFKQAVIEQAFSAYSLERPDFAPVPNSIAARCKLLDGRPDENEAWAQSLISRDERETVVWTQEMAEAFGTARPLLESGDEIGARMAFKDAYSRLVTAARAMGRPAVWNVSAGWDAGLRQVAMKKAAAAGLLEGPQPHLLLTDESDTEPTRPEGLRRVLEALATLEDPADKAERSRVALIAAEGDADRARRLKIDAETRAYLAQHPEARYGSLRAVKDSDD